MGLLFFLAKIYPFLALAACLPFIHMGRYYRARNLSKQWICWSVVGLLVLTALLWVINRGDLNSDDWVHSFIGSG